MRGDSLLACHVLELAASYRALSTPPLSHLLLDVVARPHQKQKTSTEYSQIKSHEQEPCNRQRII